MSELRTHLRTLSPDLADAADDLWRRSAEIHERQNRPGSLTQNGRDHVKAVELGIWRLLCSTTRLGKPDSFDLFNHAFPIFVLSAAACCHDFDKAMDTPGFVHGEGSADFIRENQKALGLLNLAQREAIQRAIRIHDLKGQGFVDKLRKLNTGEASPQGTYNLQLVAALLKASDILHCDCTRIFEIPTTDLRTLGENERRKYLFRRAVTGWNSIGTAIEIQIGEEVAADIDVIRESFKYIRQNEWTAVRDLLMHKDLPFNLRMPQLEPLHEETYHRRQLGNSTPNGFGGEQPASDETDDDSTESGRKDDRPLPIVPTNPIRLLSIPFQRDCLPKPLKDDFKFPKDIAFVNRTGPNCPYEQFAKRFSDKADIIVLSGPQQIGKTWLARWIIDSIRKQGNEVTAFYIGISEEEILGIIHDWAKKTKTPEYIMYALWCHKILTGIPELPEDYTADHMYAQYRFNGLLLVEDIAKKKEADPDHSVFEIITNIIEQALRDAGLNTQNIVIFFESEGMHKIEAAYPLVEQVTKTKQVFLEELMCLRNKPRGHQAGRVKAIISTRPFEFKEIERCRPAQSTDVYQPIGAFSKQECDAFIDLYGESIQEAVGADTRFRDQSVLEKMKQHAYDATSGYPFFFRRWVRSYLFIAMNFELDSCEEIANLITEENIFWYYRNPFTVDFPKYLLESRKGQYVYSESRLERSQFLEEVLRQFVVMPAKAASAGALLSTYCRRFKYMFDRSKCPSIPLDVFDDAQIGLDRRFTDEERPHALTLVQLGLVTFKSRSRDGRFLIATNRIIERFFDPRAVAEWMDIELKEEKRLI